MPPPTSPGELLARAELIAGLRLGELAARFSVPVPEDLRRAKGFVGGLVERALGATAGSRTGPDFPELGIELKTLPVDRAGRALESTFVCTIELSEIGSSEWEESRLWSKLRQVLWMPVEGVRGVPVAERRLGSPFLWRPTEQDVARLRTDWEALSSLIALGRTGELTGHLGKVLQVRPKAARGASRRRAYDADSASYSEQPKGFYLRAGFTTEILARYLLGHPGLL